MGEKMVWTCKNGHPVLWVERRHRSDLEMEALHQAVEGFLKVVPCQDCGVREVAPALEEDLESGSEGEAWCGTKD